MKLVPAQVNSRQSYDGGCHVLHKSLNLNLKGGLLLIGYVLVRTISNRFESTQWESTANSQADHSAPGSEEAPLSLCRSWGSSVSRHGEVTA